MEAILSRGRWVDIVSRITTWSVIYNYAPQFRGVGLACNFLRSVILPVFQNYQNTD